MILLGFILGIGFTSVLWYLSNRHREQREIIEGYKRSYEGLRAVDLETGTRKQVK